jgi:acyl carrier protein phosphodiesterase
MNYLAHAFLSPPDSQILLGNMACDMIRPDDTVSLSEKIKEGMALHQDIDRFTDKHYGFKAVRDLLNSQKLPYAGVFTDIIFDHCLARDWESYSTQPLSEFSHEIYMILNRSIAADAIPGHFPRLATALVSDDWFSSYASSHGLQKALARLKYRSSREIPVELIMNTVLSERKIIDSGFDDLMQALLQSFPHNK